MNPNLPPLGKYSTQVIDRDALSRAFNVPPGFNDQQTNFWLAKDQPGGTDNYKSPDTLDMDLLRRSLTNGANASIEQINQSLGTMAAALNADPSANDPAALAFAESAAMGTVPPAAKGTGGSPVVPRQDKPAGIIGLSAPALTFRSEVAARLRTAGY